MLACLVAIAGFCFFNSSVSDSGAVNFSESYLYGVIVSLYGYR